MWIAPTETHPEPSVKVVDFGCSRLDKRLESGRNWVLAENGAGHIGKWPPEMMLRLRISDRTDVWGLAVSLLELHSGRAMWCGESDGAELICAQFLGLTNSRSGLPEDLLRRSPLDIRQLYTPSPSYFPVQKCNGAGRGPNGAQYKELQPSSWGLDCILGGESTWDENRQIFASFVLTAMTIDPEVRPLARDMLDHTFITREPDDPEVEKPPPDDLSE